MPERSLHAESGQTSDRPKFGARHWLKAADELGSAGSHLLSRGPTRSDLKHAALTSAPTLRLSRAHLSSRPRREPPRAWERPPPPAPPPASKWIADERPADRQAMQPPGPSTSKPAARRPRPQHQLDRIADVSFGRAVSAGDRVERTPDAPRSAPIDGGRTRSARRQPASSGRQQPASCERLRETTS